VRCCSVWQVGAANKSRFRIVRYAGATFAASRSCHLYVMFSLCFNQVTTWAKPQHPCFKLGHNGLNAQIVFKKLQLSVGCVVYFKVLKWLFKTFSQ